MRNYRSITPLAINAKSQQKSSNLAPEQMNKCLHQKCKNGSIFKTQSELGMVVHICNPSYSEGGGTRTARLNKVRDKNRSRVLVAQACNPSYLGG
jgi:hypothetical protein